MITIRSRFSLHSAARLILAGCIASAPSAAALAAPAEDGSHADAASRKICRQLPGVAFSYPADWSAEPSNENVRLRPAGSDDNEVYVIGLQELPEQVSLNSPKVTARVDSEMNQYFPLLKRYGEPARFRTGCGPAMAFQYRGTGRDGNAYSGDILLTFVHGKAAVLLAVASKDQISDRLRGLLTTFASITPTAEAAPAPAAGGNSSSPIAQQWLARLRGKKLAYFSSYSSGSGGGFNSQREIRLFRDGTFANSSSSSVSIYVGGANGGSNGQSRGQGTWRVQMRGDSAVLELIDNGRVSTYTLSNRGGKTYLNGARWFVVDL